MTQQQGEDTEGVARQGGEAVRGHSRQREKWLRQEKVGGRGRGGVATGYSGIAHRLNGTYSALYYRRQWVAQYGR